MNNATIEGYKIRLEKLVSSTKIGLSDKSARRNCSVQFLETKDARDTMLFEHFCIAVLNPPYNKPYHSNTGL